MREKSLSADETDLPNAYQDISKLSGPSLSISVHQDIDAIEATWRAFEKTAVSTLYQTFIWCRAWLDTVAPSLRARPAVVIGRDEAGQIAFLLPFQIRSRKGVKVLEWLTAPHAGYGLGVFDADFLPRASLWFGHYWPWVMNAVGPVDAICLTEMPKTLHGCENPLAGLAGFRAPNRSYAMRLAPDFDSLYRTNRSGEDRRTARKKEKSMANAGDLAFGLPADEADLHATLDVMFDQQASRLAERGVHGIFGPTERAFIHRIAELQDENAPVLAPYRLTLDGETMAIMMGGIHGGAYWALISSLTATGLRKHSPGDIALRHTIEACCRRGLSVFDFSAGDSRYKKSWADEVIQLHCILRVRTLRGLPFVTLYAVSQLVKRSIKESPPLLEFANRVRQVCWGHRPVKPSSR